MHFPVILAYLDPSAGSQYFQIAVGGLLAATMMVRQYWRRITALFARKNRS
jgi:hypothetical protein